MATTTSEQETNSAPRPSRQHIIDAAAAIALALEGKIKYAVVGGGACCLLGSRRVSDDDDIDVVVPQGRTQEARSLLRQHPEGAFQVESRTLHTYFVKSSGPRVEVQLLASPGLFREAFTESTPTVLLPEVGGARILQPTLLLNAKCGSVQTRPSETKQRSDAEDIVFLLGWCRRNGVYPTQDEVPHATAAFVRLFIGRVPSSNEHWVNAGYDLVRY